MFVCPYCRYKNTQKGDKIICSFCGKEYLAEDVKNSSLITIVGDLASGKSTYMTVMINALEEKFSKENGVFYINDESKELIDSYKDTLKNGIPICATPPIEPAVPIGIILNVQRNVFFKCNVRKNLYISETYLLGKEIGSIKSVNAVILLIDPLSFQPLTEKVDKKVLNNCITDADSEPADILEAITASIRKDNDIKPDKLINMPTAVVFTKWDAVEGLLPNAADVYTNGEASSEMLEKLICDLDDSQIANLMKKEYRNYKYFAVSSYGHSNFANDGKLEGIAPYNVEAPIMWLLKQMKII